ncbi:hypothetical protein B0H10DRAFT_12474 [Mycena sp. CBHHK59/15]|nr:hypothetical protein B0H10DRAFT_12474 [Mycena sp. CBHHK59/15]
MSTPLQKSDFLGLTQQIEDFRSKIQEIKTEREDVTTRRNNNQIYLDAQRKEVDEVQVALMMFMGIGADYMESLDTVALTSHKAPPETPAPAVSDPIHPASSDPPALVVSSQAQLPVPAKAPTARTHSIKRKREPEETETNIPVEGMYSLHSRWHL